MANTVKEEVIQEPIDSTCDTCSGEGLNTKNQLCESCGGTGKQKEQIIDFGNYKPGTHVVTKSGTFIISPDGKPMKQ